MQKTIRKILSSLTFKINIINFLGPDPAIEGVAYDSRAIKKNFLFIALKGLHVDGHNFIEKAISQGAVAILYSEPETEKLFTQHSDIAFLKVENTRTVMSDIAAEFYGNPAEKLVTIGVTGTDGKTSTVYFIDQLLEMSGYKSGFISTAACKTSLTIEKNPFRQSTPEGVEINRLLYEMLEAGKTHAVIESTSHGLSDKNRRLGSIKFDAAVFTNLSHEHLEFHGTFEQYRFDKANLFRRLKSDEKYSGFGVANIDDKNSDYFIQESAEPVYTCSLKNPTADFFADKIETRVDGSSFRINISPEITGGDGLSFETEISLPGLFNIENALEAFAVVFNLTEQKGENLAKLISELSAVKGRMKVIDKGQPFTVLVDYAHTPGSFKRLFPDLRKQTKGRLITVFGSAGERDTEKRPEQGEIAAESADIIILADEDPRGEDSMTIIKEIAEGALKADRKTLSPLKLNENLFMIPDREEAIQKAVSLAQPKDTIITLGKGHEGNIFYSDKSIPWDEQSVVEKALAKNGF
ncbi:MAG: UDP-N-acetylmuramoyl-L-alanyl-D-glutamate--2,6-diaminopimelate ligase [Spirochaetales bacterium]|nr:UDP-N-acetylmuramoyl-L-alanyl-D-glutamate--2,6-diaminopimelate ligase [Spirochaetales bacterium]